VATAAISLAAAVADSSPMLKRCRVFQISRSRKIANWFFA